LETTSTREGCLEGCPVSPLFLLLWLGFFLYEGPFLYGLGRPGKLWVVDRLIAIYNIDVCFLLEKKIKTYTDSFILRGWNNNNVN
jgi:hypothetical protein